MNETDRWALGAGWIALALFVTGIVAVEIVGYPGSGSSLSDYGAAYADDTRKAVGAVNWLFTTVGGVLILWLIAAVHANLALRQETGTRATLFMGLGLVLVVLLMADAAVDEGYAGSSYFDAFAFDETTAPIGIALNEVRFALEVQATIVGAAIVFVGTLTLRQLEVLPTWFARGSFALAVVLLVIALPLESLAVLIALLWLVVASSLLLRSEPVAAVQGGQPAV